MSPLLTPQQSQRTAPVVGQAPVRLVVSLQRAKYQADCGAEWRLRRNADLHSAFPLFAPQNYVPPPPAKAKFFSERDEIMLEDESGRVRLIGEAIDRNASKFVTGELALVPPLPPCRHSS